MRKKVIVGSFVLICGVLALWCLLLLSDSRKKLRIDLTFVGTTNSDGQQFAIFRLNNAGTKTIVWNRAFVPWECRAETEQGWTNYDAPWSFTVVDWLLPATNRCFRVPLPEGAQRWQIGASFQEASPWTELAARIYHLKSVRYAYQTLSGISFPERPARTMKSGARFSRIPPIPDLLSVRSPIGCRLFFDFGWAEDRFRREPGEESPNTTGRDAA